MILKRFLAILEVGLVLKLIGLLSEGCYYLKYAEIDDLEKNLTSKEVTEETDGLVYRKTVRGILWR
jgi:hypothetical protein